MLAAFLALSAPRFREAAFFEEAFFNGAARLIQPEG
jgi:hypothetical protein